MGSETDTEQGERGAQGKQNNDSGGIQNLLKVLFEGRAGMWTALSTVVMCVFSGLLWHISSPTDDVNRATQRATLNPSGPVWQRVNSPDGKSLLGFKIYYAWTNSGNTPAMNGLSQFNVFLGDTRPEKGLDFSGLPQNRTMPFILGPKGAIQLPEATLTVADVESVEQGKKHLFFWGWATYGDGITSTARRLTEFCTDITGMAFNKPEHSDSTADIAWNGPPCITHNYYDEQCNDYSARAK
jgi:hypothetical protein